MERLELDAGHYPGTYKLIGGRPSLDFVNTISWPNTVREHDWLSTSGNVDDWLRAVGIASTCVDDGALRTVRKLRGIIADVLRPLAHGVVPAASAVRALSVVAQSAAARRQIDPIEFAWVWPTPARAADVFDPVILDATEIVTGTNRHRLKYCPACDWLFEDSTRNGQRRWCDMADCGSRAKANDYYHRTKAAAKQGNGLVRNVMQ
jgi:predicted RNA-binding Zn ribbon-like protein